MGEGVKKAVVAVILAAGRSSRMGRPKQVEPVDGVPMVVRAVTVALQSDVDTVVVVTGAYALAVGTALQELLATYPERLSLLHNVAWATGQASSVRAAVEAYATTANALLFLPVDQPFLACTLLQQLLAAWQQGARLAAPAINGQMRGAPAIFDQSLFSELAKLEGDTGARPLFQRHRIELVTVPAMAEWLQDIDTPQDLENFD